VAGLLRTGEIADDQGRAAVDQVGQRSGSVGVAGVDNDLVPVVEQGGGGGSAEFLGGTGDEDAAKSSLVRLVS
jgi:hypothetical protein